MICHCCLCCAGLMKVLPGTQSVRTTQARTTSILGTIRPELLLNCPRLVVLDLSYCPAFYTWCDNLPPETLSYYHGHNATICTIFARASSCQRIEAVLPFLRTAIRKARKHTGMFKPFCPCFSVGSKEPCATSGSLHL